MLNISAQEFKVHIPGKKILKPENVLRLIYIFGTTYSCKSLYSTPIFIESQYCFILTDEHITEFVPATLTIFQPNFKRLAVI
jgi:hypothetical protein